MAQHCTVALKQQLNMYVHKNKTIKANQSETESGQLNKNTGIIF